MSNEVEIVVVSRDATGPGFAAAEAKARASGERAGKAFSDGVDKSSQGIGKNISAELVSVGETIAKAGETAGRRFGDGIGKGSSDRVKSSQGGILSSLSGMVASIGQQGASAGTKFGTQMVSSVSSAVGPLVPILAGVAVAAAPFIGAALMGAVVGAAGAGGILGGILLVKDDPAIKAAGETMGRNIMSGLRIKAEPFVQPVLAGIKTIQSAFTAAGDDFGRIFAKAATWVQPLATAVSSVITRLASSTANLFEGSDQTMAVLADGIVRVGDAIGDMFDDFATHGEDAALGLKVAFDLVVMTIAGVSTAVNGLATAFGFLARAGVFGRDYQIQAIAMKIASDQAAAAARSSTAAINGVASGARNAANGLKQMSDALKAQYSPAFALIQAQRGMASAQTAYNNTVKTYGANSAQAKAASVALAQAAVELGVATGNTAGQFTGKLTPAMRATLVAAGLNAAQIANVESAMIAAANAGNKFAKKYQASIQFQGAGAAIGAANSVRAAISAIPSVKYITLRVSTIGGVVGLATGGVAGSLATPTAATGGARSGMVLVGEQGPELVRMAPGSQVIPAGQTKSMLTGQKAATQTAAATLDSGEIVRAINALGRDMRSMQLVLNGRVLAEIQGREADLFSRAG